MKKLIQITCVMSMVISLSIAMKAQNISTFAGNGTGGFFGDGSAAMSCELNGPYGTFIDRNGNFYIADALNHRIRKIGTTGVITTIAGNGIAGYAGDGNMATSAQLNRPTDVAVDTLGNVYIADELNNVIRKINASGIISTYAGTSASGYTGDGGLATSATLTRPNLMSIDRHGNLFISLYQDNVVRKVNSTSGIITTVAGNGFSGFSGDGGLATSASFNQPCKVAVDYAGNIFIADEYNNRIRKVSTSSIITTVAGNGISGFSGDGGLATSTEINFPEGIALDAAGNLYISDKVNQRIRKVNTSGIISTIVGTGGQGYSGDGGLATLATLHTPEEITFDHFGNLYISDWANNVIRKVTGVAVGMKEVSSTKLNLNLYPNPSNGNVTIEITGNETSTYHIFNLIGSEVKSGNLTYTENKINMQNLPNGMYTIVVSQKNFSAGTTEKTSVSKISLQR